MKVLLFGDWPLAITYLAPLSKYLRNNTNWTVAYGGNMNVFNQHLPEPDVVISCDELSAAPRAALNICIFHGLASKGQAFSTARRDAFVKSDTIFAVPGPYYEKLLLDLGVPPERIFVSGLTKLDGMERKILYAPTHNLELSAIPVVRERIYEIPNITVHLHQWTRTGTKSHHKKFLRYHHDHVDNEEIADILATTDVVIGDFGSIIVEAIALGKQAIQVVNPKHEDWYLGKQGLTKEEMLTLPEVYLPTKYGIRVNSYQELQEALGVVRNIGNASEVIYNFIKASRQS